MRLGAVLTLDIFTATLAAASLQLQPAAATVYVAVVQGTDVHVTGSMSAVPNGIAAASGAKIETTKHNGTLHLTRGGDISLCQSSVLGIDARGSQLFLALQSGTLEARYPLSAAADNLLTADYRVSVISGSGMPGQTADYRIGIGAHGDMLIQVLPTSQSYLIVSSNFETSQAVVRPGEIRGFPAFGSSATNEQIQQTVALRCPFENPPQQQRSLTASGNSKSSDPPQTAALQVPLAYRSPELPSIETKAPPPTAATPAPTAKSTDPEDFPPNLPTPTTTTTAQEQPSPPVVKEQKHHNAVSRFFRRLFGRKS